MPTSAASRAAARGLSPVSRTGVRPVSAVRRGDGLGGVGAEPVRQAEHAGGDAVDEHQDRGLARCPQLG